MPKLVVFLKNSTLLALLVVLFCTNPQIQSNAPELPNPQPITPQKLMRAACHFALNKVCNGSGGFTGDTLVKTSTSYAKISDLKTGTLVITFDETTGYLCEQSVTAVTTTLANTTLWLTLGDEESTTICTGTQQTFYSYNPLAKPQNPKTPKPLIVKKVGWSEYK